MRLVVLALVLLGLFESRPVLASAPSCEAGTGTVFEDRNGNGRMDGRERGLAGIRVSDGVRLAVTDKHGRYRLSPVADRPLFVIKPAGYRAPRRSDGLPDTWQNVQTTPGPTLAFGGVPVAPANCRDFALQRQPDRGGALSALVLGDPQPKSATDVDYYRRDIIEPLLAQPGAQLGITLGDLVNDDLSLYPALKAQDARLGIPWLHTPGNHDLDFDASGDELSLSTFHREFGPDTYAWEEARANFVVLDDVIWRGGKKSNYVGGLRPEQFTFLESYLPTLPRDRLLVLTVHIPLFDPVAGEETFRHADRERLFGLLQSVPHVLLLSAHTHAQRHYFHTAATGWHGATPLHEFNMGAACGGYWSGLKDADGIPASTMSDGTPNGYARLDIGDHGDYRLRWFPARAPAEAQIGLHTPRVLRHGAYPGNYISANVYMAQDDTPVDYRIDGGAWQPMQRILAPDPAYVAINLADDEATSLRSYDRSPEATPSAHLWRGVLPTDLAVGAHHVEVRARLAGFGDAFASADYRLEEHAP